MILLIGLFLIISKVLSADKYEEVVSNSEIIDLNQLRILADVREKEEYYVKVVENIINFSSSYVFLDILKSPPQFENKTCFQPVDIIEKLRQVPTQGVTLYEFYGSVLKVIASARDDNFYFLFLSTNNFPFNNIYAIHPLKLFIDKLNDIPKIYATTLESFDENDYIKFFKNGKSIRKILKENEKIPLASIGGVSPFQWIQTFGEEYLPFGRVENSRFSGLFKVNNIFLLSLKPIPLDNFASLEVVYENGESFSFDFSFVINSKKITNQVTKDFNSFSEEMQRVPLSLNKTPKNLTKSTEGNNLKTAEVSWDYKSNDESIYCKEDKEKEVNVFLFGSFNRKKYEHDYQETLEKCVTTFSNNSYPVVVIQKEKSGRSPFVPFLVEMTQPMIVAQNYLSLKHDKGSKRMVSSSSFYKQLYKVDTCEPYNSTEGLFLKVVSDKLKEGLIHNRTEMVLQIGKKWRKDINRAKRLWSKIRKPTEIVIFSTFSFDSATSTYLRLIRNNGGGIIAGYFGNPESDKKFFDIALGDVEDNLIEQYTGSLSPEVYATLKGLGVVPTSVQVFETVNGYNTTSVIPEEFLLNIADEMVPIFSFYEDKYYSQFIDESKRILNKYKKQCNPKNLKLMKVTEKCYTFKEDEHAHGGYLCGENGRWSNVCEPFYCDEGYYFNTTSKRCLKDPCYQAKLGASNLRMKICLIVVYILLFI